MQVTWHDAAKDAAAGELTRGVWWTKTAQVGAARAKERARREETRGATTCSDGSTGDWFARLRAVGRLSLGKREGRGTQRDNPKPHRAKLWGPVVGFVVSILWPAFACRLFRRDLPDTCLWPQVGYWPVRRRRTSRKGLRGEEEEGEEEVPFDMAYGPQGRSVLPGAVAL